MQAQALAQCHVYGNVGRRTAGEKCGNTAFAQAQKYQRVRVATQLPEHDQRVDHQRHKQHAADQYREQVQIAQQSAEARRGEGGSHQAENPQRCKADNHAHDQGDAVGQVIEHGAGGIAGMTDCNAHADGPRQDADKVGIDQRVYRVVDHAQQQALQYLADTAGRGNSDVFSGQYQVGREHHAGDNGHDGGSKCAEQVQHKDRTNMGFLTVLVVGNRGHDQHKHQDGCYGFQGADEHLADKGHRKGCGGRKPGQQNTGNQTDHNLGYQAGALELLQQGRWSVSHKGFSSCSG